MADCKVALAATFTAEPIERYVAFWLEALGHAPRLKFAPFNQVHQQLLDPSSLFHQPGAANLAFVRLDDWRAAVAAGAPTHADGGVPGGPRFRLPNGLEVCHLNRYETEYVYREIFVDEAYLRHGVTLAPGDCVIDIGANIGLFSMFVQQTAPGARVFAFEPSPPAFEALRANVARYGALVTPLPYGIGDRDSTATFTSYTHSSVFSSFAPDSATDRSAIRAVIRNVLDAQAGLPSGERDALADELVQRRLETQTFTVPMRTLSSLMHELAIERIDLLKVDAEKSELGVLRGLTAADWARIQQVVIEVHDAHGDVLSDVQRLLAEAGFAVATEEEALLKGSGLYNVYARRPGAARQPVRAQTPAHDALAAAAHEFAAMVRTAAPTLAAPLAVIFCPSPARSPVEQTAMDALERQVAATLAGVPGVSVVTSMEWTAAYPVGDLHDPDADRLGQIPYTSEAFAALGTVAARQVAGRVRPRAKVIVADCDNTLWSGVVGEDGVDGVVFDAGRRALHAFLLARRAEGVLLAWCSKNAPEDVRQVLETRAESLLRPEHASASEIGWERKSEGLRRIARALDVGLDSLVFLDDNPVECAEVRAACPEVVVWQVPPSPDIPRFLRHLWPLDAHAVTAEDRRRAEMYREEGARRALLGAADDYAAFIAGLGITVEVERCTETTLTRAAQLAERTNQFNFSTVRRTASQIRDLAAGPLTFEVISVTDRFGDYGHVGVVAYAATAGALDVDTLLLSCRVLGKGVEHRVLAHLGAVALARGLERVQISFVPSARNAPARRFAESLAPLVTEGDGGIRFSWPAAAAAAATFHPDASRPLAGDEAPATGPAPAPDAAPAPGEAPADHAPRQNRPDPAIDVLSRLPADLWAPAQVMAAAAARRDARLVPPATAEERLLAGIWAACLHVDRVGADENFFDLGGDSIVAVQIASRARAAGLSIGPRDVLETGTVQALAALAARTAGASARPAPALERTTVDTASPGSHHGTTAAGRAEAPGSYALTPMQRVFHAHYSAGLDSGFEQWDFRLQGDLVTAALGQAWTQAAARHPALRSSFHETAQGVVQRVNAEVAVPWRDLDWRDQPPATHDGLFDTLRAGDRAHRFDLGTAPLMRVAIARLADAEWRVLLTFHHLVLDGWSWPLLLNDVLAAYAGALDDAAAPPFADYVRWLHVRDHGPSVTRWARLLDGVVPSRIVGALRPGLSPLRRAHRLGRAASGALASLARHHRVTFGAVAAAAWALVLAEETGAPEVVFGMTMSGRPAELPDAHRTVGTFVANVPLRVRCQPGAPVSALLTAVAAGLADAADHQHVPLADIQQAAGVPPRDRLFDSLLVVQNYTGASAAAPAFRRGAAVARLTALRMPVHTGYPVTVVVVPGADLEVSVIAQVPEAQAADVDRWLRRLTEILVELPAGVVPRLHGRAETRVAAPDVRGGAARSAPVAPRTALEHQIAGVWAGVFGHAEFGVEDNFFELGGHSLLMILTQSRLASALAQPLSIVELFQYPTIAALAARLEAGDTGAEVRSAQSRAQRQLAAQAQRRPVGSLRS